MALAAIKHNMDKRKGFSKLKSRMSDQFMNSEVDELVPEGHHKNMLRQKSLLRIKMNLSKNLSDQHNAIAKGEVPTNNPEDKIMANPYMVRNSSVQHLPVVKMARTGMQANELTNSTTEAFFRNSWFKQLDFQTDPVASQRDLITVK